MSLFDQKKSRSKDEYIYKKKKDENRWYNKTIQICECFVLIVHEHPSVV